MGMRLVCDDAGLDNNRKLSGTVTLSMSEIVSKIMGDAANDLVPFPDAIQQTKKVGAENRDDRLAIVVIL